MNNAKMGLRLEMGQQFNAQNGCVSFVMLFICCH